MTKQEELLKFVSQYLRSRFTTTDVPEDECDTEAEFIFKYLDSRGAVLRVESGEDRQSRTACAGYEVSAVEPLIEE